MVHRENARLLFVGGLYAEPGLESLYGNHLIVWNGDRVIRARKTDTLIRNVEDPHTAVISYRLIYRVAFESANANPHPLHQVNRNTD